MLTSNTLLTSLADVSVSFAAPTVSEVAALGEPELLDLQRTLAEIRRRVDTASASVAAEVARRSHFSLGHDGLAQRLGARTAQSLVQRLTGSTAREAAALVRVGTLMATGGGVDVSPQTDASPQTDVGLHSDANPGSDADAELNSMSSPYAHQQTSHAAPWLADVLAAVAGARLSVEAADVIRAGLGEPDGWNDEVGSVTHARTGLAADAGTGSVSDTSNDASNDASYGANSEMSTEVGADGNTRTVTIEQLVTAARQLLFDAATCTVEQLAVRARHARATLDAEADASRALEREQARRNRRYLYLSRQPDGMTRLSGLLDPESAAMVTAAIDAATSPRRGGPRFVGASEIDRAERIVRDRRSNEQLAVDTLVELVRIGGNIAPATLLGTRSPAVQVLVAERDLIQRSGLARIDGQSEPVSVATAERHICESGTVPITINHTGDVIALGRENRLYTRRQRLALAARDGGCRFPACTRPPSWAEAHHIIPWSEGGRTDLHNGVLLCRHHHLLLHNNGWRFAHIGGELSVIPPQTLDPHQKPIAAPSRNPIIERVRTLAATSSA